MIGAEYVDDSLRDTVPDAVPMIGRSHRWIHLGARAEPLVAIGRHQCEVMRRCFTGGDILVISQKLDLLLGRNMQNVNPFPGFMGELDKALGRDQRRRLIAPHRV